jgi:hypothetical protein
MYYAPSKTQNYLIIYYYVVWAKIIFNYIYNFKTFIKITMLFLFLK